MVSATIPSSKHGYQYLKTVVLKPYKQNHRNFFIGVAVLILVCFAYVTWSVGWYYGDYDEYFRPVPREAYCEPALFDYGLGQHEVRSRSSSTKSAAELNASPQGEDLPMALYMKGVLTLRDFKNFLRAALQRKLDPIATLAMSRRFLRTIEQNLNRLIQNEIIDASSLTLDKLKQKIFSAINDLQNPTSCKNVINCRVTTESGISSGLHDVLYCLVQGLQRNRTVALDTRLWHNFKGTPWQVFFRNLSSCSTDPDGENIQLKDEYRRTMNLLPTSVASEITENHGDPYAWWYGVLMTYILRPSEEMKSSLEGYRQEQTKGRPYVAIHIRRTDKEGEALYRPLEAYLAEAEEYFARLSLTQAVTKKLVYIATDDPNILEDLDSKFRSYNFISNKDVAVEAYSYSRRRKASAVLGIMKDYHMLSHADHLICTLSSGFCRLAYELMNGIRNDAWLRISSLDNDFYYAYVLQPERKVVEPYEDAVFTSEIRGSYTSDVPDSYQQMIHVALAKSYSPFGADGFAYTNDVLRTMAKFKTAPVYPTMTYDSIISKIIP